MDNFIKMAEFGRELWLKENFDKYDYVLVLPEDDNKLNNLILSVCNELNTENGIILAKTKLNDDVRVSSEYEINSIIKLYELYEFTDKLIIGSFTKPKGRRSLNLLNIDDVTLKEIVEITIFNLKGRK